MKLSELEKLTMSSYLAARSNKFDLEILSMPAKMVLKYQLPYEYETPTDAVANFEKSPSDHAYKSTDGFVYFNDPSSVRMIDIGKEINRVFELYPIRDYLRQITEGPVPRLTPQSLELELSESGKTGYGQYAYLTYKIPGEEEYKLTVAITKKANPEISISVFITKPTIQHFDGTDSFSYPVYLSLIKGTLKLQKNLESTNLLTAVK